MKLKVLLFLTFVTVGHCGLLGSKKCTYGPSYWCSHIEHARECNTMQHCMSTVWKNQLQGLTGSAEGCNNVIKVLDDVRHSGAPDLLGKMAESCTKMPDEKRSVCKHLMMKNQNEMLLLLQSDLPSVNVAAALGLCGSFSDSVQHYHDDSVPHLHNENRQAKQKNGNYCTDCLNFFGDLQEILNNTEEKVAERLKSKVCTKLGYFEKLCNETVDTYTEFIFTFLTQQLNPEDMCFLLQLCPNESQEDFMKRLEYISSKLLGHKEECDVCQNFAKDLQNALRDSTLQNDILSLLENEVCPMLPGKIATQCKTYVSQYGYVVFQVLIAELDPVNICQTLGFCNATEVGKKLTVVPLGEALATVHLGIRRPQNQAQSSPQCALCELVIKKLEDMISTNATEAEIVAALEEVCTLLPSTLRTDCDHFIQKYGEEIVHFFMTMAPESICTALGLCAFEQPVHVERSVPVTGPSECEICKLVAGYVQDFLKDPNTETTLAEFLNGVCALLPSSFREVCGDFTRTCAADFINLLYESDDPEKVCSKLKVCGAIKVEKKKSNSSTHPLTFVPMAALQPAVPNVSCDQGPEVWCASMENAKSCNAVEYCAENKKLKVDG